LVFNVVKTDDSQIIITIGRILCIVLRDAVHMLPVINIAM